MVPSGMMEVMNTNQIEEQLAKLYNERDYHRRMMDNLAKEAFELSVKLTKLKHPCYCVKLNRDIEVYTMDEEARRNRTELSYSSFVSEAVTARKDCPDCHGTGKSGHANK